MQDWVGLLIAFVVGFFAKHLLGTVCESRLVEGTSDNRGADCKDDSHCDPGYECSGVYGFLKMTGTCVLKT